MRELFIYNKLSGKGVSEKKLNKIKNYLLETYPNILMLATSITKDAYRFTKTYIKDTYLIFVLGGDGTIHDVVSAIMESPHNPTICIIPNGTMNDLAKTLSIPRNYRQAIDLTKVRNPKPISIMQINDQYAIYASAIGRYSSTSYSTPQYSKKVFGKLSYFCHAIKDIWHYPPFKAELVVDGKKINGNFALLLMCLGPYVAGFHVNRNSKNPNTAKLIMIQDKSKSGSFRSTCSIAKVFLFSTNENEKNSLIKSLEFSTLTISFKKEYPIVLDGEKYVSEKYDIRIIPKAIRIICGK